MRLPRRFSASLVVVLFVFLSAVCSRAQTSKGAQQPAIKQIPPSLPQGSRTASGVPLPQPNDVILEHADNLELDENNLATAAGNVAIGYRGYTLHSDKAVVDTQSGQATFSGNVHLDSSDKQTSVTSTSDKTILTLNLRTGNYSVKGGEQATISPSAIPQSGLLLPLRMYAGDINAQSNLIDARAVQVTTCDFPDPHYYFFSEHVVIIPGKRLVARNVSLYRRNRRIATIPVLVIPLDNRYARQGLTPMIGDSAAEGYFVKFANPYALSAAAVGILRLDFMQYKGVGTGFEQSYTMGGKGNQGGTIKLYQLYDKSRGLNTLTGSLTHNETIFGNVLLNIDSQFQSNSYLASQGASESMSTALSLARNVGPSNTLFSANLQQSDYGFGLSNNISSTLEQKERLSNITNFDLKFNYTGNTFGSGAQSVGAQNALDTDFDLSSHPKGLQIDLLADSFTSLTKSTGDTTYLSSVERLPEIQIQTDPVNKKQSGLLAELLPSLSKMLLSFGEFHEGASDIRTARAEFGLDFGSHVRTRKRVTSTSASSFDQAFYGDATARYVLKTDQSEKYQLQHNSNITLDYSYLRPYGYTPFLFDRTGNYNNANLSLNLSPDKVWTTAIATGYDFTSDRSEFGLPATPWQNVSAQVDYTARTNVSDKISTTYDLNDGQLFDVTDELHMQPGGGFMLNSSLRYTPSLHKFSTINGALDLPIIVDRKEDAGYRIQALAGYDGLTGQYLYKGLSLTRSWHDWELSGVYQDTTEGVVPGGTFYINLRLKAFPGFQPFGVGQFGEGLDTGIGQIM